APPDGRGAVAAPASRCNGRSAAARTQHHRRRVPVSAILRRSDTIPQDLRMIEPFLTEALSRLDAWLGEVCGREDARARRLARAGGSGWAAVQAMARPSSAELAFDDAPPPDLLPGGDHSLIAAREAFHLSSAEAEALLVLAAMHLEPRYRSLYG